MKSVIRAFIVSFSFAFRYRMSVESVLKVDLCSIEYAINKNFLLQRNKKKNGRQMTGLPGSISVSTLPL